MATGANVPYRSLITCKETTSRLKWIHVKFVSQSLKSKTMSLVNATSIHNTIYMVWYLYTYNDGIIFLSKRLLRSPSYAIIPF